MGGVVILEMRNKPSDQGVVDFSSSISTYKTDNIQKGGRRTEILNKSSYLKISVSDTRRAAAVVFNTRLID